MKPIVRRLGYAVAALAGVAVLGVAAIYVVSERKVARTLEVATAPMAVPTDSATLARGRHLARAIAKCADCHAEDLGGATIVDVAAMGRWTSPNLTRGGLGANRTDAELAHAIRHGVDPKGRRLLLMPSSEYAHLSAPDLAAIVAYLRSVPAVARERQPITFGPIARLLIAFNAAPFFEADLIDHAAPPPAAAPPEGETVEYGAYLARVGGCHGCHGATLSGGPIPGGDPSWPPAANLTPTGIGHYTDADFATILRTGKRPDGSEVNAAMPVRWTKEMTDSEIRAVLAFLRATPPREYGNR